MFMEEKESERVREREKEQNLFSNIKNFFITVFINFIISI